MHYFFLWKSVNIPFPSRVDRLAAAFSREDFEIPRKAEPYKLSQKPKAPTRPRNQNSFFYTTGRLAGAKKAMEFILCSGEFDTRGLY